MSEAIRVAVVHAIMAIALLAVFVGLPLALLVAMFSA